MFVHFVLSFSIGFLATFLKTLQESDLKELENGPKKGCKTDWQNAATAAAGEAAAETTRFFETFTVK